MNKSEIAEKAAREIGGKIVKWAGLRAPMLKEISAIVERAIAESQAPCAKCGGSGKLSTDGWGGVVFQKCYLCKGTGKVEPELGDTRELKAALRERDSKWIDAIQGAIGNLGRIGDRHYFDYCLFLVMRQAEEIGIIDKNPRTEEMLNELRPKIAESKRKLCEGL